MTYRHILSPGIYSVDLKADEPAMLELANDLNVPLRFYPAAYLEMETPRVAEPSQVVFDEIGTHSVAEASALAAAGADGVMIARQTKNRTCHRRAGDQSR
jgi:cobalt-precorrin 5A hydrolase/precorrin-3B C17-methyltransferase